MGNIIVDNRDKIKNFFKWEEDTFYTFKIICRRKDGVDMVPTDKREIMIKHFIIDSQEKFDQQLPNMIKLTDLVNGRLYFTTDRKSTKKCYFRLLEKIHKKLSEAVINDQKFGISEFQKLVPSVTSEEETSAKGNHWWFFDVDTKDSKILDGLKKVIVDAYMGEMADGSFKNLHTKEEADVFLDRCYTLDSKNGYHFLAPKEFNKMAKGLNDFLAQHPDEASIHENNIALLYACLKNE